QPAKRRRSGSGAWIRSAALLLFGWLGCPARRQRSPLMADLPLKANRGPNRWMVDFLRVFKGIVIEQRAPHVARIAVSCPFLIQSAYRWCGAKTMHEIGPEALPPAPGTSARCLSTAVPSIGVQSRRLVAASSR